MLPLSDSLQIVDALDYASGSADRTGSIIDMEGREGCLFIFKFAAIAAGATTSVKVQQGAVANMSDAADLAGTGISVADDDDDQTFVIDVVKPQERYLRGYVDKDASNATAEVLVCIPYGARKRPVVSAAADELTIEQHISPAEGTA